MVATNGTDQRASVNRFRDRLDVAIDFRSSYHPQNPMRVDHEKRGTVCSVVDPASESHHRRLGVERGDGFRRMWIGQDIHARRAEFRAATDVNYRAEVRSEEHTAELQSRGLISYA